MQSLSKKAAAKWLAICVVIVFLLGVLPINVQCQDEGDDDSGDDGDIGGGGGGGGVTIPTGTPTASPTATTSPTAKPSAQDSDDSDDEDSGFIHRITPAKSNTLKVDFGLIGEIALIILLVVGGLVGGVMVMKRRGTSEKSLRKMSYADYQAWVIKKMRGTAASSMDTSRGIDGFSSVGYPLSIKQTDSVGMRDIDLFASSVARKKARNGVIVAFGFSPDAIRGKVRARSSYGLDIQMMTVQDLLMSQNAI
ncbi:MAG: hypothetical protein NWE93_05205 [Candidatus Bathyarchaeota archaeon]|nr:hypothetical protein [Candidatus Bathyarchaeota archaeon]